MHNYDGKSSIGDASSFNASNYYGSRSYNKGFNNYNNNNSSQRGTGSNRQIGTLGSVNDGSSVGTGNNLSLFSS